jgi:hypothetical protein
MSNLPIFRGYVHHVQYTSTTKHLTSKRGRNFGKIKINYLFLEKNFSILNKKKWSKTAGEQRNTVLWTDKQVITRRKRLTLLASHLVRAPDLTPIVEDVSSNPLLGSIWGTQFDNTIRQTCEVSLFRTIYCLPANFYIDSLMSICTIIYIKRVPLSNQLQCYKTHRWLLNACNTIVHAMYSNLPGPVKTRDIWPR